MFFTSHLLSDFQSEGPCTPGMNLFSEQFAWFENLLNWDSGDLKLGIFTLLLPNQSIKFWNIFLNSKINWQCSSSTWTKAFWKVYFQDLLMKNDRMKWIWRSGWNQEVTQRKQKITAAAEVTHRSRNQAETKSGSGSDEETESIPERIVTGWSVRGPGWAGGTPKGIN